MNFNKKDLNSLFRYALSLSHREEWAYDLVSHGVEKVLSRPFILNKKAYAKKCIRNKFLDELKREKEVFEQSDQEEGLDYLEQIIIDKDQVANMLNLLKPLERELLYLWAVEDYSLQEIGSLTQTPRGTLTSRLSRLKTKLNKCKEENPHE